MLFNSIPFLFVFLPLTLAVFLIAGRISTQAAVAALLAASLAFYSYWQPGDLPLLALSIAVNFILGGHIGLAMAEGRKRGATWLLRAGIVFNLGLIAVFKYLDFGIGTTNAITGTNIPLQHIALPLGISFFTFTQITFLVDVYHRKTSETNPLRYALFVTFFPHLIAGPILHQDAMGPQFQRSTFGRVHWHEFGEGLTFLAIGLFKKVALADPLGTYVDPVFAASAAGGAITFWEAWTGTLAYSLQIYLDFSGYCDMAVGLGLMVGVRLPINFNSPYKATSIIDFWRRWHITLSQFLRDYLYIPLGGSRHGRFARYRNVLVTMLLGGLWHGANWTFVLWGALHGGAIALNHVWRDLGWAKAGSVRSGWWAPAATFLFVTIAWVPFRSPDVGAARHMLAVMAGFEGVPLPRMLAAVFDQQAQPMFGNALLEQGGFWLLESVGLADRTLASLCAICILLVACWSLPNSQTLLAYDQTPAVSDTLPANTIQWRSPTLAGVAVAAVLWVSIFALHRPSHFLYFNF